MSFFKSLFFGVFAVTIGVLCFSAPSAMAATCSIASDTVIDQTYVTDNTCTAIEITGNVSTTWVGTVNLGGGTVTVKSGNTMTMGTSSTMTLGATDDLIVESGATISHTEQDPNGVQINARNVSIYGSINTNGRGCLGSVTGDGYGPDPVTGVCTLTTSGYGVSVQGGAGYGGHGGGGSGALGTPVAGATYGSSTYPTLLGSGGSGGGGANGSGGGRVHIIATGILTLDGTIYANGLVGSGGSGSGGSIYIRTHELTGSGSMRANGESAGFCSYGGGGGGGRIAVYYETLGTFSLGNILTSAGLGDGCRGGLDGEKGTTYILNGLSYAPETDLRVTSGLDFTSDLNLRHANITLDSGARISCGDARSSFEIDATGALTDNGAIWTCTANFSTAVVSSTGVMTLNSSSLTFSNTDEFTLSASSLTNDGASITVSKAGSTGSLAIHSSTLTLTGFTFSGATNASTTRADGGTLFFPFTNSLSLVNSDILANVSTTLATLSMDATSSLNANGKGCPGSASGAGFGPDPVTGICTSGASGAGLDTAGGAGYGGAGGSSAYGSGPSLTYGSATYPYALGSGGSSSSGSSGGGRILLNISGTATVNGTITANAANGGGSGSSGGSVNIRAETIMGTGSMAANGASIPGWCSYGGGGGGGRIALAYRTLGTFDLGSLSVTGGPGDSCRGGSSGADGSTYTLLLNQSPDVPSSLGPTALANGSTTSTNTPTFSFNLSDPDGADTLKYRIIVDDTSNFSSPVVDYTSGLAAQGARTFQVGQAAGSGAYATGSAGMHLSDGTYYWEVRAIDGSDAVSSYTLARGSGLAAFLVDTASITVTPTTLSLTQGGSAGSYTVVLGSAPTNTVQILLSTAPELTLSASRLTFTDANWDTPQTVTVSPRNSGSFDTRDIVYGITQTVSSTIANYAALTPSSVTVTLRAITASASEGSGGGGIGAAGGISTIATGIYPPIPTSPTPVTTVTFLTPPAPEAPAPALEPLPNTPGLLTVVNPRDIEQVVERFNQGQRDEAREQVAMNQLQTDLRSFRLSASDEQQIQDLATFISYGLTEESARLGSGERRAVVRDALETLRTTNLSPADLERLVHGQIPQARNLTEERRQATRALATFRTIYGHVPDFQNAEENLAWNTLMYRIRFPRNLEAETQGIQEFRATFHRTPQDPFQWATVRVMGYVNR